MRTDAAPERWRATHYWALFAAFMLVMQVWTWIGWALGGPYSITEFKTPGSVNWWAARAYEVGFGILFFCLLVWVVRRCLQARSLLFDAKLMIAGVSLIWLDAWTNIAAPIWMYSSNFVNLNNPLAGFPLPVNPDMGRLPFPLLLHSFVYPTANLCAAIIVCALMRKLLQLWPRLSTAQLIFLCVFIGIVFDIAFELPMFLLGLWAFPGTPDFLALFADHGHKFPIWEMVPAGIAFATFGALRFFKDDKGREVTERGLDRMPPWRRNLVSTLALMGVLHAVWLGCTTVQAIVGFYADPYKPLPKYLINDMCDAPVLGGGQVTGTRYGPCPQEGLRFPIRYLPGTAPGSPYGPSPYDEADSANP
jgi:hypothetical protein